MALSLHDTLSGKKIPFRPRREDRAGIYACGPTVYRHAHIGNLRTYLLTDILARTLKYLGCAPFVVQNITDMGHMHEERLAQGEDKVIAAARAAGKSAREIALFFTEAFFRDCRRMNFLPADVHPRASAHVPEMIALARELERRGTTYREGGTLYFDVAKAEGYGDLSGAVLGTGSAAERTDAAIHLRKRRPEDFTLWLPAEPGREYSWESPWGVGWPGWHVECAAMALKYLGPEFDVHVGGIDLKFPHHENSRVMAMTATGGRFAALWLHAGHLLVDGRKMSKSQRNEHTLDDLAAKGFSPADFRYHCLTLHYRTPMNFTWEGLRGAATALSRLRGAFARPGERTLDEAERVKFFRDRFREAICDDLNVPRALGSVHEAAAARLSGEALRALGTEWDAVLGVGLLKPAGAAGAAEERGAAAPEAGEPAGEEISAEILLLVRERDALRRAGRFAEADALRARIRAAGYDVVDRRDGPAALRRISAQGGGDDPDQIG